MFAQLSSGEPSLLGHLQGGRKGLGVLEGSRAKSHCLCSLRNPGTSPWLSQTGGHTQPGPWVDLLKLLVSPHPLAICVLEKRRRQITPYSLHNFSFESNKARTWLLYCPP